MRVQRKLAGVLAGTMLLSMLTTGASAVSVNDFTDMPNDWSTAALQNAVENGLIQGNNGKIDAQGLLTRAQMAAIVNRAFGATKTASITSYTDVASSAWYYADMQKAVQMGTFQGSGNKLTPDSNITRQEAFTVLARAFSLADGDAATLSKFSDSASVASWAQGPVAALVAGGYINGANGKINPNASITRAEFAQMMDNLVKVYAGTAHTADVSGNVIVKSADSTLTGAKITGDLIIGDGVGTGNVTLDNVTVTGRVVVRGGGVDSIHIKGTSNIPLVIVANPSGGVRVVTEGGAKVTALEVNDGSDAVILEGSFGKVTIASAAAPIELRKATIDEVTVTAANAAVTVDKDSKITKFTADKAASSLALTVNGTISELVTAADSLKVTGTGKIVLMTVTGGTGVTVSGVTVDKVVNNGDSSITVNGTEVKPSTGGGTGGSSGGGGGGGSSTSTYTIEKDTMTNGTLEVYSMDQDTGVLVIKAKPDVSENYAYRVSKDTVTVKLGDKSITVYELDADTYTCTLSESGTYKIGAEFELAKAFNINVAEGLAARGISIDQYTTEDDTACYKITISDYTVAADTLVVKGLSDQNPTGTDMTFRFAEMVDGKYVAIFAIDEQYTSYTLNITTSTAPLAASIVNNVQMMVNRVL